MASFSHTIYFNKFCIFTVLVIFSLMTCITPYVHCQDQYETNLLSEGLFIQRIQKLVDKLVNLENSSKTDDMIGILVKIKNEIESHYGDALPLERIFNETHQAISKGGYVIPKTQWNWYKGKFKRKNKNFQGQIESNVLDDFSLFEGKKDSDKDDSVVEMPLRVTFGVTMALCGFFLCCIPIPFCKEWGQVMISSGVLMAIEGGISNEEKKDDKENKKDK